MWSQKNPYTGFQDAVSTFSDGVRTVSIYVNLEFFDPESPPRQDALLGPFNTVLTRSGDKIAFRASNIDFCDPQTEKHCGVGDNELQVVVSSLLNIYGNHYTFVLLSSEPESVAELEKFDALLDSMTFIKP